MDKLEEEGVLDFGPDNVTVVLEQTDDRPEAAHVLEETADTVTNKMGDYGNSWEKVGVLKRVMADEDGPQIVYLYPDGWSESKRSDDDVEPFEAVILADTPQKTSTFEENADDVITRLLDKLVRAYNLLFLKDEPDVENESTEDAGKDLTGYSSMLTSLIRRA